MSDLHIPSDLKSYLENADEWPLVSAELLHGGDISRALRIVTPKQAYVVKCCKYAPADLYAREAEGLKTLKVSGGPKVPDVHRVADAYLLLEDLGKSCEGSPGDWAAFGRQFATLHLNHADRYGFAHDNYLGLLPQLNEWSEDGIEFFIQKRILRFVDEGQCREVLTVHDRQMLDQFCRKFCNLVPVQPPVLCHGDLWHGNLMMTGSGQGAVFDPAVYYGWAEADLAMTTQYRILPDTFYLGYNEVNPLQEGWQERLEVYHIKEFLSRVAHLGEAEGCLETLRAFLRKYVD